jgi:hypothetical protein
MMMKTNEHPITPPPELVKKIFGDALRGSDGQHTYELRLIHAAYAAGADQQLKLDAEPPDPSRFPRGADQELKACCLLLDDGEHAASYGCHNGTSLRAARRPKPPSLKEQALNDLALMDATLSALRRAGLDAVDENTIRRALETLDD